MKKLNLLKISILVMSVLFSTQQAFSQDSTTQTLNTSVSSAVAVEKVVGTESGIINPTTGAITGTLSSSFKIQTNETDAYDFIVYSKLITADGALSAFDSNGNILFANTNILPTGTAVEKARSGISGNANVIGYKMDISVGTDMTVTFQDSETYDESYVVNLTNSATSGTISQTITGEPALNTYNVAEDIAGTYSTTVYVTVVPKVQ